MNWLVTLRIEIRTQPKFCKFLTPLKFCEYNFRSFTHNFSEENLCEKYKWWTSKVNMSV